MDGRAIGAGALSDAGPKRLASEMEGPRPEGIGPANRTRPAGVERVSKATNEARVLRPLQP